MGVVRLVAAVAKHPAGVFGGCNLRKVNRLGCIFLMAAAAEISHVGKGRLVRRWVWGGSVRRLRPMAGFAGDMSMFAGRARFGLIVVAQDARILAGIGDGPLANHLERPGTVMPILAEAFGDHGGAHCQKQTERSEQHNRGANQVA